MIFLIFSFTYDIDIYLDCQDTEIYKCSSDNRVLYEKIAVNTYKPILLNPSLNNGFNQLIQIFKGIPSKQGSYYMVPQQDLQITFLDIDYNYLIEQPIFLIQGEVFYINLSEGYIKYLNHVFKINIQDFFLSQNSFIKKIQMSASGYNISVVYVKQYNQNQIQYLDSKVVYTKNLLVFQPETALYNEIMRVSFWVDIVLEVASFLIQLIYKQTKMLIVEYKQKQQTIVVEQRPQIKEQVQPQTCIPERNAVAITTI